MKKITLPLTMMISFIAFGEKNFEINKKNCNLPMKKIKEIFPDKTDQQAILKKCMEKAAKERWKLKTLSQ